MEISNEGDESDVSKPNYFGKEYFAESGSSELHSTTDSCSSGFRKSSPGLRALSLRDRHSPVRIKLATEAAVLQFGIIA
jgi:hypothetical protein